MKLVRYISAQPAIPYYTWQVEVMINNFMEMGVNPNQIDIVCWKKEGVVPEAWSKLANKYAARFFFYEDTRETSHYISSIRPNILKQHFKEHSYLENDVIFYHDCDIMFTKPVHEWITDEMINDDIWYGSDVRWYIGHDYILSKGEDVLDKMCEIVGIHKQILKDNELNSIGAQYLMKSIDWSFWEEVERDCERLFKDITDMNSHKVQLDGRTMNEGEVRTPYHPLQIWCADMWALLWQGWKRGITTKTHPNFDFSWGTSSENEYLKMNIFHNAGVTSDSDGLFYKAKYMNTVPYHDELDIRNGTASKYYWDMIKNVSKKTVLI
jgi:hypothetical protein